MANISEVMPMKKIVFHTLKAWLAGLLFVPFVSLPFQMLVTRIRYGYMGVPLTEWIEEFSGLLSITFVYGFIFSLPLLLVALIIAIVFRKFIEKYSVILPILAPAAVVILVTGIFADSSNFPGRQSENFVERFQHVLFSSFPWLFVLPVFVAALYFWYFYPHSKSKN